MKKLKMVNLRTALRMVVQAEGIHKLVELKNKAFKKRNLLRTNIALSFTLSAIGDIVEQQYERYEKKLVGQKQDYSLVRTRNMGLAGTSIGIICHYWYMFLDKRIPGRTITDVIKKTLLDQLICSPVYITAFFISMGLLERQSPKEVWEDLKTKAIRLYTAEWLIWPGAQFINFYWLPSKYRVFYDNIISLGYDVYTSRIKYEDDPKLKSS